MPPLSPWILDPTSDHNVVFNIHWGKRYTAPLPIVPGFSVDTNTNASTPRPEMYDLGTIEILPERMGKFIVREEYKIAMEKILNVFAADPYGAVLVRGQEGIGKSLFLWYILVQRLQKQLVTGFHRGHGIVLFTALDVYKLNGVLKRHQAPASLGDVYDRSAPIWMLIDVDFGTAPDSVFVSLPFFPIQATPLNPEKYRSWAKQKISVRLIMNPWTWEEILFGLALQKSITLLAARQNISEFFDRFYRFGPSARNVYNTPTDVAEHNIDAILRGMNADQLHSIEEGGYLLELEAQNCLMLMSRKSRDNIKTNDSDGSKSQVTTQHVLNKILRSLAVNSCSG